MSQLCRCSSTGRQLTNCSECLVCQERETVGHLLSLIRSGWVPFQTLPRNVAVKQKMWVGGKLPALDSCMSRNRKPLSDVDPPSERGRRECRQKRPKWDAVAKLQISQHGAPGGFGAARTRTQRSWFGTWKRGHSCGDWSSVYAPVGKAV